MEVYSDEQLLKIKAPNGDSLELDKETNRVYMDGSVDYPTFIKLVKQLKKEKNKQSFSIEYYDE
jgi:cell division septal protein FtsQ